MSYRPNLDRFQVRQGLLNAVEFANVIVGRLQHLCKLRLTAIQNLHFLLFRRRGLFVLVVRPHLTVELLAEVVCLVSGDL